MKNKIVVTLLEEIKDIPKLTIFSNEKDMIEYFNSMRCSFQKLEICDFYPVISVLNVNDLYEVECQVFWAKEI